MSRFLRENSQIIASILIAGYTGVSVTYRINKGVFQRDDYEFKTKGDSYLGISLKEEEPARKFIYRLENIENRFEFFRSNTLDFLNFGYNKLRQGALIGLPFSFFANSKSDTSDLISNEGFKHFFGHTITIEDLNKKLDQNQLDRFYDSIILSQDAKLFALGREIASTENFFKSNLDRIIELLSMSAAYFYSFSKTRAYKLQLYQRKRVYIMSSLFALSVILASRFFTKRLMEETQDFSACQMGLDCCEGSIEFYDKLIERNKILRQVLSNGDKLIDQDGNILKQEIKIPFTDYNFLMNNLGIKLTERREKCKIYFSQMIKKLSDQMDSDEAKKLNEMVQSNETDGDNKELKIFKALRLKLENLIHSK